MDKQQLLQEFIALYGGDKASVRVFTAPGRVNLIGEHTDYNGGFVLPAALNMGATVALRVRNDKVLRMKATDLDDVVKVDLNNLSAYKKLFWGNYQVGVAAELEKAGYEISGCDMLYDDTVPHGGGLSSSAAIEVVTALALATLSNEKASKKDKVDMVQIAKIAQRAENNYIGVNCGIMDQFASAMGKKNHAILLDCRDLNYKYIPVNINGYKIVIANTNKRRSLSDSKYNKRRRECECALMKLKAVADYDCLGVVPTDVFEKNKKIMGDETIIKRAKHVVYECDRVVKSADALRKNDIMTFARLMNESHDSLKDLYEVTGIELDTLVDEARKIEGCIASRMTGAGFGGCTVSIVEEESIEEFRRKIGRNYKDKIGYAPSFYVTDISDGGREI